MSDVIFPDGIKAGHYDNGRTGVTVIMCKDGAVGGVDVRGCAPGTRETDCLHSEKAMDSINAIVLTGGSAFGLGSIDGVMQYLREKGCGHDMGVIKVPLVSGAVIYDLKDKYEFPTAEYGYNACVNADKGGEFKRGAIGAGTGATVGKITGLTGAMKSGIGAATVTLGNVFVTAVTVVNAVGDIYDPDTGRIVAGARLPNGAFLNTKNFVLSGEIIKAMRGGNTTLSCVMTNAKLDKLHCNKLASISHDAFAQCIRPVHTDYDGDTIFALSKGEETVPDFTMLSIMAVEAVNKSILDIFK